ncbi:MAG: NAD(P)-dependent oxidoreductase [Thermoguttaceae bacterium]
MNGTDNPARKEPVGFIGLGLLGAAMAGNVAEDGHLLRVYNRTPEKARPLLEKGAQQVSRPEQTIQPGGILMTCLADDQALESMFEEHPGLFDQLGPQGVHLSMSTIGPETARRLAQRHAEWGGTYVAAPVMGRPDAAAARMQTYFVSGPTAAVARVKPILTSIGRAVFEFGNDPGAAHVAKLAANFLIAASLEAMAEAFALARKNDLDPAALHAALTEWIFACPIYKNYGRQVLSGRFEEPLFRLALGLKDMGLVSQLAFDSRTPMPLAGILRDRLLAAVARGRGDWDWTALAAEVEAAAGLAP